MLHSFRKTAQVQEQKEKKTRRRCNPAPKGSEIYHVYEVLAMMNCFASFCCLSRALPDDRFSLIRVDDPTNAHSSIVKRQGCIEALSATAEPRKSRRANPTYLSRFLRYLVSARPILTATEKLHYCFCFGK
jgi:hypothetical protein